MKKLVVLSVILGCASAQAAEKFECRNESVQGNSMSASLTLPEGDGDGAGELYVPRGVFAGDRLRAACEPQPSVESLEFKCDFILSPYSGYIAYFSIADTVDVGSAVVTFEAEGSEGPTMLLPCKRVN